LSVVNGSVPDEVSIVLVVDVFVVVGVSVEFVVDVEEMGVSLSSVVARLEVREEVVTVKVLLVEVFL
jgi:hypothetical protein